MDCQFSIAEDSDWKSIQGLLLQLQKWLRDTGKETWQTLNFDEDGLKDSIREHDYIMAEVGGELSALICLQAYDLEYWPEYADQRDSIYLHRLCVDRRYAGKGLTNSLVGYAENYTREKACSYLRLDCAPEGRLLDLYRHNGFEIFDRGIFNGFDTYRMQMKVE